ncbi:tyrosine-protein phosphatase [Cohnella nanjingensis]|uniref:Tyrosine-protein phosphatase n=1 Tax=Cohnella nanjingensis TaxID=1387779 RepID=A0A7X0VGH5_9BACL|nr:tyrosine-protein phosphatase [Cohnella nanjingensis]MBB6671664.1 tyrosine-protein phosphatase [Cohnella nanjingensis]
MNALTHVPERRLIVEGAYNVRDLGGYPTADGRTTRWGRLYRADGLHKLTEAGQQAILERGVAAVVDLRHASELETMPNVFADSSRVAYHNVDLINPTTSARPTIKNLGDMYVNMLDDCQPALTRILSLLADSEGTAALYHCTAGKDRTGLVSALLLDLARVPHDVIAADYALTAECLLPIMDELRQGRPEQVPAEMYEKFLGCDPENMELLLAHLVARYGGAERFMLEIGLTEAQVDALKAKLLGE